MLNACVLAALCHTVPHRVVRLSGPRPPGRSAVRMCAPESPRMATPAVAEDVAQQTGTAGLPVTSMAAQIGPPGCPSCELEWLKRGKETEDAEQTRLSELRASNLSSYSQEVWEYGQHMNDTLRQELALQPDMELRRYIIESSTPPTPLMEHVYNSTMQRVAYEQACYICGPEQAMLLRTLVGLTQPRRCLDVGTFTGFAASAVVDALPASAQLTCIDVEPEWTKFAAEMLGDKNVDFVTKPAMDAFAGFEKEGRQFDLIVLDADKPNHGEYFNASLRLLRPSGVIIMFGMILFPTVEDQQAMEALHTILPNDTRIATAQLPVGCGIQICIKLDDAAAADTPRCYTPDGFVNGEEAARERKRYALETELAAIDRRLAAVGKTSGGATASGPGTEALSSKGLVALAASRRMMAEAADAAPADGTAPAS